MVTWEIFLKLSLRTTGKPVEFKAILVLENDPDSIAYNLLVVDEALKEVFKDEDLIKNRILDGDLIMVDDTDRCITKKAITREMVINHLKKFMVEILKEYNL